MAHAISHLRSGSRSRAVPAPYVIGIDPVLVPCGPTIRSVPEQPERPFLSVMILVAGSTEHLGETLKSILVQDLGRETMDIEVIVAGASDSDSIRIARDVGGNRIYVHRLAARGTAETYNECIRRARGHWVHIVHCGDVVRRGLYKRARGTIAAHPEIGAFTARHIFIDGDGAWLWLSELLSRQPAILAEDFIERQLTAQQLQCVTTLVRRSVYETLGGFREIFRHCPDWDMWNRVILTHRVFHDPEFLGCHRVPEGYVTEMVRTGENVREERRCLRTYCGLLPRPYAKRLYREGMGMAALRALRRARYQWRLGDPSSAMAQLGESARCCLSAGVIVLVFRKLPATFGWLSHQPGI